MQAGVDGNSTDDLHLSIFSYIQCGGAFFIMSMSRTGRNYAAEHVGFVPATAAAGSV